MRKIHTIIRLTLLALLLCFAVVAIQSGYADDSAPSNSGNNSKNAVKNNVKSKKQSGKKKNSPSPVSAKIDVDKSQKKANRAARQEKNAERQEQKLAAISPVITSVTIPERAVFELEGDHFAPVNKIDELLAGHFKKSGLTPAPLCSDSVFIRRVYVDLLGRIPFPREVIAFLQDTSSGKRATLIDRLLEDDRFNDYQALKWADLLRIKAEFPINLWPNGTAVYHRWIQNALRNHVPYDQFARELLTSSGSNFRNGPANFWRAVQMRDPDTLAGAVSLVFLGYSADELPEKDRKNLSKFFSRVAYKGSAQWKEELVYWDRKPLDPPDVVFPDGTKGTVPENRDPREIFADWLIRPENRAFNRNFANRVWYWLFGYGIVQESDNFRTDNPAICPELLDYLADELVKSRYDVRYLYRLILNSRTYQQSSLQKEYNPDAERNFAVYPIRRLDAEVLQDAFIQIFQLQVTYMSEVPEPYSYLPAQLQTVELPDASITSSFLEMFGRSTRDTGTEIDRNNDVTASQELFFINSNEINQWVKRVATRMLGGNPNQKGKGQWQKGQNAGQNAGQGQLNALGGQFLWLSILSRYPTEGEKATFERELAQSKNRFKTLEDVIWTLINSKEFLCRH